MPKHSVLVIEDDHSLAEVVGYNLQSEDYQVFLAHDGESGLAQAQTKRPDVIVLDLMLPVLDGLEVCRRLRADSATRNVKIIMLTAKAEESDELVGFSLGADDYVTKPFSVKILLERIKALCRRSDAADLEKQFVSSQGIAIDPDRHRVTVNDQPITLTRTEFQLLETLLRRPGRAFNRAELIDAALGGDAYVLDRTIDVHIRSLRKKLGEGSELIETVRGIGYRFRDPSDRPQADYLESESGFRPGSG